MPAHWLAAHWFLTLLLAVPRQSDADFFQRASALKENSSFAELEKMSAERLTADAEDLAARAFLAVAFAGQQKFDESVRELQALEQGGFRAQDALGAFGSPLAEVTDAIYMHCWANFDPAFNERCWGALFAAFPDSPYSGTPASRLLMAALKKGDATAAERLAGCFDQWLERAKGSPAAERSLLTAYCQAHVRAGIGGDKTLDLARRAFTLAWDETARAERYAGPDASGADDLEKREKCDVECDDAFNNLVLACALSGALDAPGNPLTAREAEPGAVFDDATKEAGLEGLRHGRVAAGDYDEDGDPDLCCSGVLLRNEGGRAFVDVTEQAGIKARGGSALFGDYDNDGDLDLLLPAAPHPFLLANGGKKEKYAFRDVTDQAGLAALKVEAQPEGAAWFDLDGDGFLDFYLAVYEEPMAVGHPDLLIRNNRDGTFRDVSQEAGILAVAARCGRGVAACDFDADGDQDVYVSNYRLNPNFLFRNDGKGKFADAAAEIGVAGEPDQRSRQYFGHTIGSAWGDIDNDGDFDLFSANLAHPRFIVQGFSNLSMLYVNAGAEQGFSFADERRARGIRFQETHSDPALADIDNDGDLDLSVTCTYEGVPSCLYQNDGAGRFQPITCRSRAVAFNGWGQAWLDYDDDGDLDLVVGSGSGMKLFRNRGNGNHWVKVNLVGRKKNRFGVGARVVAEPAEGEAQFHYVRELTGGRGTTSQDGYTLHFGLGGYRGKVRISVTWPDTGKTEKKVFFVNRTATFRQTS